MIKVYNTLSRTKEKFIVEKNKVRMYVCGITPYDYCHIGHLRCYLTYDVIRRYLLYRGYEVLYVQNFTDVDDKIIERAKEEGITASEVAEKYISSYFKDMLAMGIMQADIYPRVTEHIPDIIKMIEGLIAKGFAYEREGNVYFSVDKFPDYGKLSRRTKEQMLSGARVETDEKKKRPFDFALWKRAKEGEPAWDSPWGKGRPGWHIECSAMSMKYLGNKFTIHGGAIELSFPHHENEIAQSEAYTQDPPFVCYWIHNGLVTVKSQKMAKSLGNFITISQLLQKYSPEAIRIFLLSSHYRNPIDFSIDEMEKATGGLRRFYNLRLRMEEIKNKFDLQGITVEDIKYDKLTPPEKDIWEKINKAREDFIEVMDDDFNTAEGLSVLFELCRQINIYIDEKEDKLKDVDIAILNYAKHLIFEELGDIFGLFKTLDKSDKEDEDLKVKIKSLIEKYGGDKQEKIDEDKSLSELLEIIIDIRRQARQKKMWKVADEIREELKNLNIYLEDLADGTRWKVDSLIKR